MATDLSDLIDNPRETLEVELKQWLDLSERVNQANIARHIAALCNHGGGYIVFGIKDDLTPDPDRPSTLAAFSRDQFSSIVKRYLLPTFECHLTLVESTNSPGAEFPILHVPGHGTSPVCTISDGPHDNKGRPQGIRAGTYYIRAPGPESVGISSPQQWSALIRRCTLKDRDALLREMSHVLQGEESLTPSIAERLAGWHESVAARFDTIFAQAKDFTWPLPLSEHQYQLSYLISHEDQPFPIDKICRLLEEINSEVRDTVWTGWSMFYPFTRPEIAAAIYPENADGTGDDLVETNLIGEGKFDTSMPDFWRVTPDGRASLVRGYREDVRSDNPGTWMSPETVLRETAELVRHARAFARHFPTASSVSFQCSWKGLQGREIADFDPSIYWSPGRIARADRRTTTGEWPVVQLNTDWHEIVAELSCPILSLFGIDFCSADLVRGMASRFIKL